jgi:hypothetical protein
MQPSCPGLSLMRKAGFTIMTLRQSNNPPNVKVDNRRDWERRDRCGRKSTSRSSFSLPSRGLFTKNSSWQAKRSITHTTVTFYCDCVKMCEDFAPNFGDKRTGCSSTTRHRLTLPFSPEQHDCRPHPPYCSLFLQLKIKLKGRHFDKRQNKSRKLWTLKKQNSNVPGFITL